MRLHKHARGLRGLGGGCLRFHTRHDEVGHVGLRTARGDYLADVAGCDVCCCEVVDGEVLGGVELEEGKRLVEGGAVVVEMFI